jgi:hypothetical protein
VVSIRSGRVRKDGDREAGKSTVVTVLAANINAVVRCVGVQSHYTHDCSEIAALCNVTLFNSVLFIVVRISK